MIILAAKWECFPEQIMMSATRGNLYCGALPQLRTAILKDWSSGCSQNFEIASRGIHSTRICTFSAI